MPTALKILVTLCVSLSTATVPAAIIIPQSTAQTVSATVTRAATTVTDTDPIYALANITTTTQTTSSIDINSTWFTDTAGQLDINSGWSSNNQGSKTTTTVAHTLFWLYEFTSLHDGDFTADIAIVLAGHGNGINGITLADNFGNTQTFTNSGTWSIPLLDGNTYEITATINNQRTGNNGLNVNTTLNTTVNWVIVPEPSAAVLVIFGLLAVFYAARHALRR